MRNTFTIHTVTMDLSVLRSLPAAHCAGRSGEYEDSPTIPHSQTAPQKSAHNICTSLSAPSAIPSRHQ